jgi:hypothetical protein
MYLGNRQQQILEPSVLKFTGQLTIIAHPTQLNPYNQQSQPHYAPYYAPWHEEQRSSRASFHQAAQQPRRCPLSKEEHYPSLVRRHAE